MVAGANAGLSGPMLGLILARLALAEALRVTVRVYVSVVVPSCAVTATVIVLAPTFNAIAPDGFPGETLMPFTFTAAFASATVGVIVMLVVVLETLAVYVVVAPKKAGLSVPLLKVIFERVSLADGALVTVSV